VFGKLFGRGKIKRDAFGVESMTTELGVLTTDQTTTVTTTTSEIPGAPGVDLGALLQTVREAQEQTGGDREAMADLLRDQLGGDVVVEQTSNDWSVMPQPREQDPIALLATLTELHEKGVVSDEQFEAQKRRLLG